MPIHCLVVLLRMFLKSFLALDVPDARPDSLAAYIFNEAKTMCEVGHENNRMCGFLCVKTATIMRLVHPTIINADMEDPDG